jgi:preprotein translocase subunit Sss1
LIALAWVLRPNKQPIKTSLKIAKGIGFGITILLILGIVVFVIMDIVTEA